MIEFVTGDLFEQDVDGLGHGVNCKGVMGSGIAPLFKRRCPGMFAEYKVLCDDGTLAPGLVHTFVDAENDQWIYNIASQDSPGANAKYEWLCYGLRGVRLHAETHEVASVGLPRIGAGIGGLEWDEVKRYMIHILTPSPVKFVIVSLPEV